MTKVPIDGVLKALLAESLSDTCSSKVRTARFMSCHLPGYQIPLSIASFSTDVGLCKKKEEVQQQYRFPKTVESTELETSWWRKFLNVSLLLFEESECKEDGRVEAERYVSQTVISVFHSLSQGKLLRQ